MVIAVADNGPGIAADQREKVFVPFFTTKRQGSGVGLTLVRQIATVHGAAVSISETPAGAQQSACGSSRVPRQDAIQTGLIIAGASASIMSMAGTA